MASRLTDKQKKKIIADYVELGSYNAAAKLNGVSDKTVKSIVLSDSEFTKKSEKKKEENTKDILSYMDSQKELVCQIIGIGLEALNSPEKMKKATAPQITTALGTLIDKWAMIGGSIGQEVKEDGLSQSLRELVQELEQP